MGPGFAMGRLGKLAKTDAKASDKLCMRTAAVKSVLPMSQARCAASEAGPFACCRETPMLQMSASASRIEGLPFVEAFLDADDVCLSAAAAALLPDRASVDRLHAELSRQIRDFATLVLRYGNQSQEFRHFGLVHWNAGHLPDAMQLFLSALRLTPGHAALWRDLACVCQRLGLAAKAQAAIGQALDLDPTSAAAWLMRGTIAQESGLEDPEAAFRKAVDLQPDLAEAHQALGMLAFERRHYGEAAAAFRTTLRLSPESAQAALCLGQACYLAADYGAAAAAFDLAERLGLLPEAARANHIRARFFAAILAGSVDAAVASHRAAGHDVDTLLYEAFSLFSAHRLTEAAIAVGQARLARNPGDPVQAYLLDALMGRDHRAAPVDYLEKHFDAFAPTFDEKLVKALNYRVPERLATLARRARAHAPAILDLGCGTGLAAPALKPMGDRLVGVDIAAGMLAQAAQLGLYDALVKEEAGSFLSGKTACFDLVFAADLLIYFGALESLFAAVHQALRPGGLFCLSVEEAVRDPYMLLSSGRFAHAADYIRRLAAGRFTILTEEIDGLRLEAHRPVKGRLFVLRA